MNLLGSDIQLFVETGTCTLGNKWGFTMPPAFKIVQRNKFLIFADRDDGLRIAASAALYPCGAWIHASCSRVNVMPTYYDLRDLRDVVIGPERPCAQVFQVDSEHVNIHPFCLHLWAPLQAANWPLPDFTMGQKTI